MINNAILEAASVDLIDMIESIYLPQLLEAYEKKSYITWDEYGNYFINVVSLRFTPQLKILEDLLFLIKKEYNFTIQGGWHPLGNEFIFDKYLELLEVSNLYPSFFRKIKQESIDFKGYGEDPLGGFPEFIICIRKKIIYSLGDLKKARLKIVG
jgi:hypothetical protein